MRLIGVALALAFAMAQANAGSFTLTAGGQYALCREYAKNLMFFPEVSRDTYEWPLDATLKRFRKPKWQPVDARQHIDVIKTLYIWAADPNRKEGEAEDEQKWRQREPMAFDLIRRGAAQLEATRLDFDNDGTSDEVYRYRHPINSAAAGQASDDHQNAISYSRRQRTAPFSVTRVRPKRYPASYSILP